MDIVSSFAAGREWALASFVALSGIALTCVLVRHSLESRNQQKQQSAEFRSFQRSYLSVYVVIMLADWLQGTHMYTLYSKYAVTNPSVSVGSLFFTGFMAAGLLGTFTGPLVDKYGRKRACLVYVALELVINTLEHLNSMPLLLLGRVLGGVSTSLLFSAFEAWMVTEHRARGFPEAWIGVTFGHCAVWNGATAIVAGFAAQLAADTLGDIGPFQLAMVLTALAGALMAPWAENYGGDGGGDGTAAVTATGAEASDIGLLGAWRAVRSSTPLLLVGTVYALFEGAMCAASPRMRACVHACSPRVHPCSHGRHQARISGRPAHPALPEPAPPRVLADTGTSSSSTGCRRSRRRPAASPPSRPCRGCSSRA